MPLLAGIPITNEATLELAEMPYSAGYDQTTAVLVLVMDRAAYRWEFLGGFIRVGRGAAPDRLDL